MEHPGRMTGTAEGTAIGHCQAAAHAAG